jgi:radical SAM-linked protein
VESIQTLEKGSALKVRYVIKFTKDSQIKFVSHLDMLRTIQRVVRRAGLPVEYSKGFNPHMNMSFAQPLSVGIYSEGEYLDTVFNEEVDEEYIKNTLNHNAPQGIRFLQAIKVVQRGEKKVHQTMALVEAATYDITIKYADVSNLKEELEKLTEKAEWVTLKRSKSGEKMIDLKPMIKDFKYQIDDNSLHISTLVSCGSRENLSPELLSSYIKDNTSNSLVDAFVDIKRKEIYSYKDEKLFSLGEYIGVV